MQNVGLHSEIADAQSTVRDISTLNFISHYFYLFSTRNIKYTKTKFQKFLVLTNKTNSDGRKSHKTDSQDNWIDLISATIPPTTAS